MFLQFINVEWLGFDSGTDFWSIRRLELKWEVEDCRLPSAKPAFTLSYHHPTDCLSIFQSTQLNSLTSLLSSLPLFRSPLPLRAAYLEAGQVSSFTEKFPSPPAITSSSISSRLEDDDLDSILTVTTSSKKEEHKKRLWSVLLHLRTFLHFFQFWLTKSRTSLLSLGVLWSHLFKIERRISCWILLLFLRLSAWVYTHFDEFLRLVENWANGKDIWCSSSLHVAANHRPLEKRRWGQKTKRRPKSKDQKQQWSGFVLKRREIRWDESEKLQMGGQEKEKELTALWTRPIRKGRLLERLTDVRDESLSGFCEHKMRWWGRLTLVAPHGLTTLYVLFDINSQFERQGVITWVEVCDFRE